MDFLNIIENFVFVKFLSFFFSFIQSSVLYTAMYPRVSLWKCVREICTEGGVLRGGGRAHLDSKDFPLGARFVLSFANRPWSSWLAG